ncbi:winged helix-turn-helix domain-containing protein [Paraconexibacter algicola]|uniref:Winged helix-turn-helix domain-containing protein n=1 Tax=Paraconexibacter algicola TaxID=2133960 RepID=A0A2T4UGF6_9ACTN|nr:winged helix-turn-helix domain-containing protein [Paraconexibacter algicola]PTL58343.1 hypothetical protein C7Y72_01105 [Paraconexibacter algicola]
MTVPTDAESPYGRPARDRTVLQALVDEPGATLEQLAAATGIAARVLAPTLWRLEEERRVVHEAHRWFATEE